MRRLTIIFFLASCLSLAGLAQQTGRILGTVYDETGAVVPGVEVVVRDMGTGRTRTFVSDDQGRFSFPQLSLGQYELSVEMAGFRRFVQTGIELRVGDSLTIAVRLQVGEISELVTVTGQTALLQTTTSSLSEIVDSRMMEDLPVDGRQGLSLIRLIPGITPGRQMESAAQPFNRAGNFSIGGGRGIANEIMVDGLTNTVAEGSTGAFTAVAAFTPMEATREFRVETSTYSAEYGRSAGGVVNIVTKSGTNTPHGAVFGFLRDSAMDANNFFNNTYGIPLGDFSRHQFGATLGGPIRIPGLYDGRDRSFFFVSWESLIERSSSTLTTTVPTARQKAGDFSETFDPLGRLVTIYDPLSSTFDPDTSRYLRTPFPGNVIPGDRIDPIMGNLMQFWPEPNQAGAPFTGANNLVVPYTQPIDDHKFDMRLDHAISERQQLFGRLGIGRRDWRLPNIYGTVADPYERTYPSNPTSAAIGSSVTFGPEHILDLRWGYNYLYFAQEPGSAGYDSAELGLPRYMFDASQNPEFPRFIFSGYGAGMGHSSNTMWGRQETHAWAGALSRIRGNHVTKFGTDIRMSRIGRFVNWGPAGYFAFAPAFTQGPNALQASVNAGNSLASGLLGNAATRAFNVAATPSVQNWYTGLYAQDDWRVTPRLTLNLGIRWDLEMPMTERFNQISWMDPAVESPINTQVPELDLRGAIFFADEGQRTPPFILDKYNFAPRLGLAWEVTNSMVLRGGYGIFYAPHPRGISDNIGYGFSQVTYSATTYDGVTPVGTMSDPFFEGLLWPLGVAGGPETQIGAGIAYWENDSKTPYNQQWNLNLQNRLGNTFLLDLAYSGSKGTHLPSRISASQLRADQLGPGITASVANPFHGIITTGSLAGPKVAAGQLMRPFPQYTGVSIQFPTAASSIYHSFQLKLNKRFASGLSFLTSYTAGKLIDDASGLMSWVEPATGHQDVYNRRGDRAVSDQDVSQRFVTALGAELPFGRGRRFGGDWSPALDRVLGGWQVSGILVFQTGVPLNLTTTNTSYSYSAVLRPNNSGQSALKTGGTTADRLDEWFDTSVFSQPALFTFGNVGRNLPDVRTPGQANLDFSLLKNIRFTEERYLQIRGEFFNLTNTPEFGNPVTSFQSATFGRITTQRNRPRQIQLGLRFVF